MTFIGIVLNGMDGASLAAHLLETWADGGDCERADWILLARPGLFAELAGPSSRSE